MARQSTEDLYKVLGVSRTATDNEIKKAFRKLSLRTHPDVNSAPDAGKQYQQLRDAYEVLKDKEKRRKYDLMNSGSYSSRSSRGSSEWAGWDSSDPVGWATGYKSATEEQRRRREGIPQPDELNDSFGALFSDAASAVFKVVAGKGDWISLLEELLATEGADLETLLRSRDIVMLEEEFENAKWVQETLAKRIQRLSNELSDNEADLNSYRRERGTHASSAGSVSRSYERELESDISRSRERLRNAKNLLSTARTREQRIEARIQQLRKDPGSSYRSSSSSYSSSSSSKRRSTESPKKLPSVEDELTRLKKQLGK